MISRRAEVVTVGDAGKRHAITFGAFDRFIDCEGSGRKRQSAAGVDQAGGAVLANDFGFCLAVDAVFAQMLHVECNAGQTVARQSFGFCSHQRLRRRFGHGLGRTGAL